MIGFVCETASVCTALFTYDHCAAWTQSQQPESCRSRLLVQHVTDGVWYAQASCDAQPYCGLSRRATAAYERDAGALLQLYRLSFRNGLAPPTFARHPRVSLARLSRALLDAARRTYGGLCCRGLGLGPPRRLAVVGLSGQGSNARTVRA